MTEKNRKGLVLDNWQVRFYGSNKQIRMSLGDLSSGVTFNCLSILSFPLLLQSLMISSLGTDAILLQRGDSYNDRADCVAFSDAGLVTAPN